MAAHRARPRSLRIAARAAPPPPAGGGGGGAAAPPPATTGGFAAGGRVAAIVRSAASAPSIGARSSAATGGPTCTAAVSTANFCASWRAATFAWVTGPNACCADCAVACALAVSTTGGMLATCSSAACAPTSALTYCWFASDTNLSGGPGGVTACTGWKAAAMAESTAVLRATSASVASSGDCAPPRIPSFCATSRADAPRTTDVPRT